MKKGILLLLLLVYKDHSFASGGYDNATPARRRRLDLELTLNPFNIVPYGQSYIVWGYGLTNRLDFHGYASHEAGGMNQIYCGFMYNFISNKYVDLSTALGLRFRNGAVHSFFPQLLYTIKLPKGFDIIGSMVLVGYTSEKFKAISMDNVSDKYLTGVTYDIALRAPIPVEKLKIPSFLYSAKFAVGAFRGLGHKWYPTYSLDLRFNLSRKAKKQ